MKTHATLIVLAPIVALRLLAGQEDATAKDFEVTVETLTEELDGGAGGIEVDAEGLVYCADFGSRLGPGSTGGDRIYRIDPKSGEAVVFTRGLRGASGNAIGPDGAFFQSNIGAGSITRVDPDGSSSVFLRENLRSPVGIAIDEEGTLFVANCGANSIVEVTAEGESSVLASGPPLSCPNGIALDDEHNLYVSNFNGGDVLEVSPTGRVTKLATLPGNNNGHLTHHEGALYVVARGAHQIFKVSLAGEVELFAGSGKRGRDDGPALEATFSYPNDLAFSPDGKTLYVNENASTTEPHTVLSPMIVRKIRLAE